MNKEIIYILRKKSQEVNLELYVDKIKYLYNVESKINDIKEYHLQIGVHTNGQYNKILEIKNGEIADYNKASPNSLWIYNKSNGEPITLIKWINYFYYIEQLLGIELSIQKIFSREDIQELENRDYTYQSFISKIKSID